MKLKKITAAVLLTLLISACSSADSTKNANKTASKAGISPTPKAVAKSKGEYYTVLDFDKGTRRLSDASKKELRDFVASAKQDGREIDDIKILAWADQDYPNKGTQLSNRDIAIAKDRTRAIEDYLKEDLDTDGNFATYNMAKRPNKVSEFFRGDDYKTKRIFEGSGPAGSELTSFMNNKASKAVIMVDYE